MGNGSVACWGEDPGSDGSMDTPQPVPNVDGATAVTAGGAHACALRRGGTVVCWGVGNLGQLGSGEFDNGSGVAQARQVSGLGNAVEISAGWNHTCARTRAGTISCWGGNGDGARGYGQLGDGSFNNRAAPVEVNGISDAIDVSAGGWTTCAVVGDGTVWCWGYGERGGLGNGERSNSATPVQVSGISDASRVVVGRFHACALRSGGVISCWGDVGWGGGSSSAVPVDGGTTVSSAALSSDRSLLIVDRANRLREWGLGADEGPQLVAVGP
jgi:alpha-tubulin suppressor-like RCC1 family protein